MNFPEMKPSNVSHKPGISMAWLTRNQGRWIGLLLAILATVTIVGAYAKSNGGILRPKSSDKVVKSAHAVLPAAAVKSARQITPQAGTLLISEFRLRGPNGANDEFVEIYNNSGAPHTVASISGTGYGVAASDGVLRCTIPNATVIPTNGHFLCTNSVGYSYDSYPAGNGTTATGDATYATDIPDNAGIALFITNVPADFTLANRFDAVGSTSEANTLYKEGAGYPALTPFSIEYSFTRLAAGLTVTNPPFGGAPTNGLIQDTDDNAADFIFVDTNGTSAGAGQRLGAPGPKNLSSPIFNGTNTPHTALDTCSTFGTAPNKVRDFTSVPANNSTFGTVDLRRTFTNNTGAPLTRLRIRLQNIATFPAASGIADLRPITGSDVVVTVDRPPCGAGTSNITVFGTTLEVDNTAPSTGQPNGGGFNSTFSVPGITAGTPLANGATVDVHFLFGIQQTGSYKIAAIAEGLPTAGDLWILTGNTEDASDFEGTATPPVIAQQGPLTRQQAAAAINSTIATVSDSNPGTLTVTATTVPAGITVSNIVNNVGTVTADVAAGCGAALGANTVVLTVTNGTTSQTATANLTVNVTASAAPTLTYSNPPGIVFGQPTTVNPSTGPTGATSVVVQSTGTFTGLVSVDPAGVVSISNSAPVGTHTITIRATNSCGTTTDAPFQLTVAKAQTNTQVSTTLNPSTFGQTVTFNVTVAAVPPGAGVPTGTVQFQDGGVNFGAPVALVAGGGTMTTSSLPAGVHLITAIYSGDGNFLTSTSLGATQTVFKENTTTATVISSVNPSVFGQPVTFTTTVTPVAPGPGSTTPTGTVQFFDNTHLVGTSPVNGVGVASVTLITPPLGTAPNQVITATYSGDIDYNGSTTATALLQTVNKADTSATTPTSTVNPTVFGQATLFQTTITAVPPGAGIPGGTVTFFDGATPIGTSNVVGSGVAGIIFAGLSAGSHSITAVYSGTQDFNGTTSAALTQVVNKASTTTSVISGINPTVFGQSAIFVATVTAVAPGAGSPSGTVTFFDGATPIATGTVNGSGIAQGSFSGLSVGLHTITATYNGDASFLTSTGNLVGGQTVVKAQSNTAPSSGTNPSVFGQAVTFTATVTAKAPGAGTPTGTVTFLDGLATIGTGTLNGGGIATFTTSALAVGSHSITMNYNGDGNFFFSFSTVLTQVVNKASTSTTVVSSVNPTVFGQSTIFTATVSAVLPGAGTPTGTVTFLDGATTLGTGTLAGGVASLSVNTLSVGSHSITVTYSGDGNFLASTSSVLTQVVNQAPTNTALTSSVNPSVFGQPVVFTATVTSAAPPIAQPTVATASRTRTISQTRTVTTRANGTKTNVTGIGTPSGTVTFFDGATQIGLTPVTLNGSGVATLTVNTLSVSGSPHSITAVYNGDVNFLTSTSTAVAQVVNPSNSNLSTVTSSANPSVFGQSVTFSTTATAATPGGGIPTGTVTFLDGATTLGTVPLVAGVATFPTSALAVGTHPITATYSGDGNFNPTATIGTLNQIVNKAATTTVITSSTPLAFVGSTVTYTATINPVAPGAGVPSGTVQFRDNGVNIGGPVTLVAAKASVTESGLTFGLHVITAIYSGDGSFLASTGTLAGGQNVGFQFIDPVNHNQLIIDVVNSKYTFITGGGVTIVSNVSVILQFSSNVPNGTRVLRFTSANPIVTEVLIDETAPGTLQGKFYVPSTGQDFVMNITSGVKLTP